MYKIAEIENLLKDFYKTDLDDYDVFDLLVLYRKLVDDIDNILKVNEE